MSLAAPDGLRRLGWAQWGTRYLFFTGKGGVGKTTTASAVAVALADAGKRTLVISTDPASNLDDVFGVSASPQPTPVSGVGGLFVANLDPEAAAEAFKERAVGPYRGVLPDSAVRNMEEQLSGACTVEVAAFNEFTAVLGAPDETAEYDHVIFDTAPTGHTLRLLTPPSAWSGYVQEHPAGASCLGPLAGLDKQREQYVSAVSTLADAALTTLVLVSRAETSALREAARASGELAALGVAHQQPIINGLLRDPGDDQTALAFSERQTAALDAAPAELAALPVAGVDLVAGDVTGLDALRRLTEDGGDAAVPEGEDASIDLPGLDELLDKLDAAGTGVVMTMGKGGVGKTTLAAAAALALVDRGHEVTLSTTDPAAHITDALADAAPEELLIDAPWTRPASASWCLIRRRPATRCCCSTRRRATTARCSAPPRRYPVLRARAAAEIAHIEQTSRLSSRNTWLVGCSRSHRRGRPLCWSSPVSLRSATATDRESHSETRALGQPDANGGSGAAVLRRRTRSCQTPLL